MWNPKAGINNLGAYLISGQPYASSSITVPASGSTLQLTFHHVTQWVTVRNSLSTASANVPVRFGFEHSGTIGQNYIELNNGESYTGEWKLCKIFLTTGTASTQASASVIASLTNIDVPSSFLSAYSGSRGVG